MNNTPELYSYWMCSFGSGIIQVWQVVQREDIARVANSQHGADVLLRCVVDQKYEHIRRGEATGYWYPVDALLDTAAWTKLSNDEAAIYILGNLE